MIRSGIAATLFATTELSSRNGTLRSYWNGLFQSGTVVGSAKDGVSAQISAKPIKSRRSANLLVRYGWIYIVGTLFAKSISHEVANET